MCLCVPVGFITENNLLILGVESKKLKLMSHGSFFFKMLTESLDWSHILVIGELPLTMNYLALPYTIRAGYFG